MMTTVAGGTLGGVPQIDQKKSPISALNNKCAAKKQLGGTKPWVHGRFSDFSIVQSMDRRSLSESNPFAIFRGSKKGDFPPHKSHRLKPRIRFADRLDYWRSAK